MKKLAGILVLVSLTGCGNKEYYNAMEAINTSIAESNSEIAQACEDALTKATTEGGRMAAALTTCQRRLPFQKVAVPEKPSKILREVVYGVIGGGIFFGPGASRAASNTNNVEGDMTTNVGPGSAQKAKHESFEYTLEAPGE